MLVPASIRCPSLRLSVSMCALVGNQVSISDSLFTKLDSNAVSVNGMNRNLVISDNEAVWLGQNFIASWGRADANSGTLLLC